ncbi:MAG: DUF3037 domain-containing protein [Gallionella sp.]|nr:DUF3037 domain-containing protein [Gallionella sp.]
MKKYACQYAIVRFLPYLETGEFANVGIVMLCPDAGFFEFKLLARVRRITAFFEELDSGIYRRATNDFKQELKRIRNWLAHQPDRTMDVELARHLFGELTRQREAMMRFDNVRVVLADDPAQQLDELFGHYVERNFATKAYHEQQLLDKTVRKVLVDAKLNKQYQPEMLGDVTTYHAKLPFVHREAERAVKAIKPLYLAHEDPAQIYDHGWAWLGKVNKLRSLRLLPEQVLFPVQGPDEARGERFDMFQEITAKMAANDVWVVPSIQTERIVEFARI